MPIASKIVASALTAALFASSAIPCCTAYGENPITLAAEKALIVWDADKKVEHFIRQASFSGKAKDFGFIVPTPTKPDVAAVDAAAFDRLARVVAESLRAETRAADSAKSEDSGAAGIEVLERLRVGDYEATIVKATDGKAMNDWLKSNGYHSRPAMESWLDHYAKKSWIFTALKFVREPGSTEKETSALRLSFKADEPFYPYKMPDDTWPKGHVRPLSLFYVSSGKAKATYTGGKDGWEANTVWSGKLPDAELAGLSEEIKLSPSDLPKDATLTLLENNTNKMGYDRDLIFASQSSSNLPLILAIVVAVVAIDAVVLRWAFSVRAQRRKAATA